MGIIACIIAAVKGHKTFAWVVGIWTAIAVVIAIAGAPQYAIGPGAIFLLIAITMKKVVEENEETQTNTAPESYQQKTPEEKILRQISMFEGVQRIEDNGFYRELRKGKTIEKILLTVKDKNNQYPLAFPDELIDSLKVFLEEKQKEAGTDLGAEAEKYVIAHLAKMKEDVQKSIALQDDNSASIAAEEEINDTRVSEKSSISEQTGLQKNSDEARATFCRKCGAQLVEGASFCRKCGTPIQFSPVEETQESIRIRPVVQSIDSETESENAIVRANPLTESQGDGASFNEIKLAEEAISPDTVFEIDLLSKDLHPKIRRASIYAEDAEWEKAEACLEAVLDEDPTNPYAYIGKLLVDYKIPKTSDLVAFKDTISENKNYQKAVRFADESLARRLVAIRKTN